MLRARPYSQIEMIALGADGSLTKAYARYIPLDKVDGVDPVPTNNESDDGLYHRGVPIIKPIEVIYEALENLYKLQGGNHRIAQAKANGQEYILALVQPDAQIKHPYIGRHPLIYNPDYHLFEPEQLILPTQREIVDVLRSHTLIKLEATVLRAFVVGSVAKGTHHRDSDIDILLEIEPDLDWESVSKLEDHYRQSLRQFFVTHAIRGKMDSVHPQWCGRRVDVYLTYDADLERRPKVLLDAPDLTLKNQTKQKSNNLKHMTND